LLQNTPLHPIMEWGRQRFGTDSPAGQRLADLENTLRLLGLDAAEYAPLVAPLLDIPLPPSGAADLSPEELRRRQLEAFVAWILSGARSQPAALAFEDMQWADPTSLDLMRALVERGAQAPLFIIATARPEFRAPWSLRPHHGVIPLAPLDRAQVARMVGKIVSRHALSKDAVEGVIERTGGVPLFVEEVTRLLERGAADGPQAIPPTLRQSLAARLDQLGPARAVAQIGAVLGHEFDYAVLAAVAGAAELGLDLELKSPGALPFPSSAGEGGAERRMGYGPLRRASVGLHVRQPETASSETCSPHPIRPFGPPPGLRPVCARGQALPRSAEKGAAPATSACKPRSTGSSMRTCCSSGARAMRRTTVSSMRWSGTPPTRACSRAAARRFTAAPQKCCGTNRNAPRPSRKSSPIISSKLASTTSLSNGGAGRATRPCAARPSRRRSPISAGRSQWRTKA
jgi:hypothetical protein